MALASATISMSLADLVGDAFDPRRVKVYASTNIPTDTVIDTAGNEIRLGTGSSTVDAQGNATLTVLVPGAGSNPASWQTYVHVDYPDKARQERVQRTFGPFTVTADVNLADLVLEQEVPPDYLAQVTGVLGGYVDDAQVARDQAVAARDAAVDVSNIATPDALVKTLVQTPTSATAVALSDSTAAQIETDGTLAADATDARVVSTGRKPQTLEQVATARYAKLLPAVAALANREANPFVIVGVGDSTRQGVATTGFEHTDTQRLAALLRAKFPVAGSTGGRGYIACFNPSDAVPSWPIAITGGPAAFYHFQGLGPNLGFFLLGEQDDTATVTVSGTSVDLVYVSGSDGPGIGRYRLDGGSWIGFDTAKTGARLDAQRLNIPLTAGAHTLEVTGNSDGSTVWFEGIVEYNGDETKGIQVHNVGLSGNSAKQELDAVQFFAGTRPAIASFNPDLLWVRLGANDAFTSAQNSSAFDFGARVSDLLDAYRASWPTRNVPVIWDLMYDFSNNDTFEPWANYRAVLLEIEATDPNLIVRDLGLRLPSRVGALAGGWTPDGVHLTNQGHQFSADSFLDFISPR